MVVVKVIFYGFDEKFGICPAKAGKMIAMLCLPFKENITL